MGLGMTMARVAAGVGLAACMAGAPAAGGGGISEPQETYTNDRPGTPGDAVRASISVQLVAFTLNAVGGKYKLVSVSLRVDNRAAPLALSVDQDRLLVLVGGRKVAASFQLSALDRPLWDALSPDMKRRLTYPEQVNPNGGVIVYAFVPLAEMQGPLEGFEYAIKSLPAPLVLQPEPKKAAAALDEHQPRG